jgi:hypothetical protein
LYIISKKRHTETHDQIQLIRRLERKLERHDEWIVYERQHSSLRENVGNLTRAGSDVRLADRFECIDPLRVLLAHLHHFAKAALADDLEQIKRLDCERLSCV